MNKDNLGAVHKIAEDLTTRKILIVSGVGGLEDVLVHSFLQNKNR